MSLPLVPESSRLQVRRRPQRGHPRIDGRGQLSKLLNQLKLIILFNSLIMSRTAAAESIFLKSK